MPYVPTGTGRYSAGIVANTRYEASARTNNANHTLRASVHDALWMITQQHRAGEYLGTDNGSVVKSRMQVKSQLVNRYQPKQGNPSAYQYEVAMDALVEKVAAPIDMAHKIRMGRYFTKILKSKAGLDFDDVMSDYMTIYGFGAYATNDYENLSNSRSVTTRNTISGKLLDGYAIYQSMMGNTPNYTTIAQNNTYTNGTDDTELKAAEDLLRSWFEASEYFVDSQDVSWSVKHLENRYKCSAPVDNSISASEVVLHAEHRDNDIDWHNFITDSNSSASINVSLPSDLNTTVGGRTTVESTIEDQFPGTVRYRGSTVKHWWEFEDKHLDFSKVRAGVKDALRLLIMDYNLSYSTNWLSLPVNLRVGAITEIEALTIKDSFGTNVVIRPAGDGGSNTWQKWTMFTMNQKNAHVHQTDGKLFIPPVNPYYLKSESLEKVVFVKDEMANLVWAVEETLKTDLGLPIEGHNAHNDLVNLLVGQNVYNTQGGTFIPEETQADLNYKLMRNMPENWIPFMAVSTAASASQYHKELSFRRAKHRRMVEDFITDDFVTPRTSIIQGTSPFDINEEELLEGDVTLSALFKRARWWNGSTSLWYNYSAGPSNKGYVSGLEYDIAISEAEERLLE